MPTPIVSVLMPAYNAGRWIGEAIASVKAQTFGNWELCIAVDGSSTAYSGKTEDERWKIVREEVTGRILSRCRIRWNFYGERTNYPVGFNLALRMASGKFIARLDADDSMRPEKLELQVAYLREHPEVDIVSTGMRIFGNGPDRVRPGRGMEWRPYLDMVPESGVCGPSIMSRCWVYNAIGGLDESDPAAPDEDWHMRTLVAGMRWGHIAEPLYLYRDHPDSESHRLHDEGIESYRRAAAKYRAAIEARFARSTEEMEDAQ